MAAALWETATPFFASSSMSLSLIQIACAADSHGPRRPQASMISTVDMPNTLKVEVDWYFASLTWVCIGRSWERATSRQAIMNSRVQ